MKADVDWTVSTLREHLLAVIAANHAFVLAVIESNDKRYDERFLAASHAITAALAAAKEAVAKAEASNEKRFESVNEFRQLMETVIKTLMPRKEMEQVVNGMKEKMDILFTQASGLKMGTGLVAGLASFILVVLGIFAYMTKWK